MNNTKLSSTTSVSDYQKYEEDKNKKAIADFLLERFTERYITPLRGNSKRKHGFTTMAISCLMIETLESFWLGEEDTKGQSKQMFISFFKHTQKQGGVLGRFSGCSTDFYYNVRCGILHQAETTEGWKIIRKGNLLNIKEKTINATAFHDEVEESLKLYCKELKAAGWDSEIWENVRKKMARVIENCEIPKGGN